MKRKQAEKTKCQIHLYFISSKRKKKTAEEPYLSDRR
jgi:hypothetical protein